MKKLLALDLGITTGYAVIWEDGEIEESGFLSQSFFTRGEFKEWVKYLFVTHAVVESPVIMRGELGDQLGEIVSEVKSVLTKKVDFIQPADWKQTPFKKFPVPRGRSIHERDAIRMGMWYIKNRLKGN